MGAMLKFPRKESLEGRLARARVAARGSVTVRVVLQDWLRVFRSEPGEQARQFAKEVPPPTTPAEARETSRLLDRRAAALWAEVERLYGEAARAEEAEFKALLNQRPTRRRR